MARLHYETLNKIRLNGGYFKRKSNTAEYADFDVQITSGVNIFEAAHIGPDQVLVYRSENTHSVVGPDTKSQAYQLYTSTGAEIFSGLEPMDALECINKFEEARERAKLRPLQEKILNFLGIATIHTPPLTAAPVIK